MYVLGRSILITKTGYHWVDLLHVLNLPTMGLYSAHKNKELQYIHAQVCVSHSDSDRQGNIGTNMHIKTKTFYTYNN